MKKNQAVLGALGIAIVGITIFATSGVLAYKGDPYVFGPNHTEEREAQMEEVIENKDYQAWYDLMTENGTREPGVVRKVTEENFDVFIEAKELASDGLVEEANELRESIGLGTGERSGGGKGRGMNGNGECNM